MRLLLSSLLAGLALTSNAAIITIHVFSFDYGAAPPIHSDPIIEVGDTVHWVWDSALHSVSSADGEFEVFESGLKSTGATFDHTFTQAGDTGYYCSLHGVDLGNGQVSGMAGHVLVANTCATNAFTIVRGNLISGDLASLQTSDNSYLTVQRGLTLNASEAPIQVTFNMTSPVLNPSVLAVALEDGVNSSGLTRRIEVRNVQSGQFEQINQGAAQLADKASQFKLSGTLANYVNQADGKVTVKVSYFATGLVSLSAFQARFDRIFVQAL